MSSFQFSVFKGLSLVYLWRGFLIRAGKAKAGPLRSPDSMGSGNLSGADL
jgi:hypothetical protein